MPSEGTQAPQGSITCFLWLVITESLKRACTYVKLIFEIWLLFIDPVYIPKKWVFYLQLLNSLFSGGVTGVYEVNWKYSVVKIKTKNKEGRKCKWGREGWRQGRGSNIVSLHLYIENTWNLVSYLYKNLKGKWNHKTVLTENTTRAPLCSQCSRSLLGHDENNPRLTQPPEKMT